MAKIHVQDGEQTTSLGFSDNMFVTTPENESQMFSDSTQEPSSGNPQANIQQSGYHQMFEDFARGRNITIPEGVEVKTQDDYDNLVGNYFDEKRYGKDNPILGLAKSGLSLNDLTKQMSQYDQVMALDDRMILAQKKSMEDLNGQLQTTPNMSDGEKENFYNKSFSRHHENYKESNDGLLADLAKPIREQYAVEREQLVPNMQSYHDESNRTRMTDFETSRTNMKENIRTNPSFVEQDDPEFFKYFDEMTAAKNNSFEFKNKIENDSDFLAKMLELAYLDKTGRLADSITSKTLGNRSFSPVLQSTAGLNNNRRSIRDSSVPH